LDKYLGLKAEAGDILKDYEILTKNINFFKQEVFLAIFSKLKKVKVIFVIKNLLNQI
jgi:hypothetical protein